MQPLEIANAIRSSWARSLAATAAPARAPYVYASRKRECTRRMVLEMVAGDQFPAWEPDTLAKFRRGNDRERDILADLSRIGRDCEPPFEITGQQDRFELRDRKGRVAIVGKVDARIQIKALGISAPTELKAWDQNIVARIRSFSDVLDGKWTRSGGFQLLSYLFGFGEPVGFMILDRPGIPLVLPVVLEEHLDEVEAFLTQAELALDHRDAGTLPDFHKDLSECKRCPAYGALCNPPIGGDGALVVSDPELEAALDRRAELAEGAEEWEDLDTMIKERLRGRELAFVGPWLVEGKWSPSTTYTVPADLKAKYKKVDEKGRFLLKITRT